MQIIETARMKSGVYAFVNPLIRDPYPPHAPLIKIGRGIIMDRYRSARKNEGTYLPAAYEIAVGKYCEDDEKWEAFLHRKFASRRYMPVHGSGHGKEWFRNVSIEEVRMAMEDVPGTWIDPPEITQSTDVIRSECRLRGIEDSHQYREAYGDDLPCEIYEMYDWLHPNVTKITKEDFVRRVFVDGKVRNTGDYETFSKGTELPTLNQIQDGYFGRVGFRDLLETGVPSRLRR